MTRVLALLLAACLAILAVVARAAPDDPAPPAAPATRDWSSGDKRFTISVPSVWFVGREPIQKSVMALRADLPEKAGSV
jgi:hypothetical protein